MYDFDHFEEGAREGFIFGHAFAAIGEIRVNEFVGVCIFFELVPVLFVLVDAFFDVI
jgi:hypothetical protein